MTKKSKKVSGNNSLKSSTKKTTSLEKGDSYKSKTPTWKFQKNDNGHSRWSLNCCEDFTNSILDKLVSFESMKWQEIEQQTHGSKNGSSSHFIDVADLVKEAQLRLRELHIEEDQLFSLRLQGKVRLFGIIEEGTFHIIWYDKNHEICPSNKK